MLHLRRVFSLSLLLALFASLPAAARQKEPEKDAEQPAFREYKGIKLGMTAEQVRKLLGSPADKGDTQDFYTFGESETAQIFYDDAHSVSALSVSYFGDVSKAPTARLVLGSEVEPKPDGSLHKMVRYPKAGYWVSYSRTAGDSPLVTVMMQRYKP
jgi:hypothetical protein